METDGWPDNACSVITILLCKMADIVQDSAFSSAYTAHKEVITSKSVCRNCIEMERRLKEVLTELSSAQAIIKRLQEESNMNLDCGNVETSCAGCEQVCSSVKDYGGWNLVTSSHLNRANNLLRHVTDPFETSNRYSLVHNLSDNLQVTSESSDNDDLTNAELSNHVSTTVKRSSQSTFHCAKSKKPSKYVSQPKKQFIDHTNRRTTMPNLHELDVGHKKLPCADVELTYSIPTIVNSVIFTGHKNLPASEEESTYSSPTIVNGVTSTHTSVELVSSRNDKVIVSDSDASVNMLSKLPSQRKEHKIMIIGDSHVRGCSVRVKNLLSNKFEVNGPVKPGTGTDVLTNSAKNDVRKLTKRDVILFWGGGGVLMM
jgi:hypothetical protein